MGINDDKIITFRDFLLLICEHKKFITVITLMGLVAGLIVALGSPREYTSTVKAIPTLEGGIPQNNSFENIIKRIDMSQKRIGNDGIDAYLYSNVIESTPFLITILDAKITLNNDSDSISIYKYLQKDIKSAWWKKVPSIPFRILGFLRELAAGKKDVVIDNQDNEIINYYHPTEIQDGLISSLRSRLKIKFDDNKNVISLSATMQDKDVAIAVVDIVVKRLEIFLSQYKSNLIEEDLDFIRQMKLQAEQDYYRSLNQYSTFRDSNIAISKKSKEIELTRLQNVKEVNYKLYVNTCHEEQKLMMKLNEYRPVLLVISPSGTSNISAAPNRFGIILKFTTIGIVISLIWIISISPRLKKTFIC